MTLTSSSDPKHLTLNILIECRSAVHPTPPPFVLSRDRLESTDPRFEFSSRDRLESTDPPVGVLGPRYRAAAWFEFSSRALGKYDRGAVILGAGPPKTPLVNL